MKQEPSDQSTPDGVFESPIPFEDSCPPVLCITCCDPRLAMHADLFMQDGLGIKRYERIVMAGGPANLALRGYTGVLVASLRKQLNIIIPAHNIQRIVLFVHEDCKFYENALPGRTVSDRIDAQLRDGREALRELKRMHPSVQAEGYFMSVKNERVRFEKIE